MHARGAAGIGRREALLAAHAFGIVAHHQVALHHVDLFPVVVHERLGREGTGIDLEEPRAATFLLLLVEVRGEDLLPEARRVARRPLPAVAQVDLHEFEMLFRLHQAPSSLPSSHGARYTSSCAMAWWMTLPSNFANCWKSSRATARSRVASASLSAFSLSNSSCAMSTALPALTGKGSRHASGVCSTMRRNPGQVDTRGTCTSR